MRTIQAIKQVGMQYHRTDVAVALVAVAIVDAPGVVVADVPPAVRGALGGACLDQALDADQHGARTLITRVVCGEVDGGNPLRIGQDLQRARLEGGHAGQPLGSASLDGCARAGNTLQKHPSWRVENGTTHRPAAPPAHLQKSLPLDREMV